MWHGFQYKEGKERPYPLFCTSSCHQLSRGQLIFDLDLISLPRCTTERMLTGSIMFSLGLGREMDYSTCWVSNSSGEHQTSYRRDSVTIQSSIRKSPIPPSSKIRLMPTDYHKQSACHAVFLKGMPCTKP